MTWFCSVEAETVEKEKMKRKNRMPDMAASCSLAPDTPPIFFIRRRAAVRTRARSSAWRLFIYRAQVLPAR